MNPGFQQSAMLRIYLGEAERIDHKPGYEWIVLQARQQGIAGATVLRGVLGFGPNRVLHSTRILQLSNDLTIVVEMIDAAEKLSAFVEQIDGRIESGLATLETIQAKPLRAAESPE